MLYHHVTPSNLYSNTTRTNFTSGSLSHFTEWFLQNKADDEYIDVQYERNSVWRDVLPITVHSKGWVIDNTKYYPEGRACAYFVPSIGSWSMLGDSWWKYVEQLRKDTSEVLTAVRDHLNAEHWYGAWKVEPALYQGFSWSMQHAQRSATPYNVEDRKVPNGYDQDTPRMVHGSFKDGDVRIMGRLS